MQCVAYAITSLLTNYFFLSVCCNLRHKLFCSAACFAILLGLSCEEHLEKDDNEITPLALSCSNVN